MLPLREWRIQTEREAGEQPGRSSADKAKIMELECENKELRTANEILKKAPAYFAKRSSTARSADDRFYRRASRGLQSRAGPPRPADHSVDLMRTFRRRPRPRKSLRPVQTRCRNTQDDSERPRCKQRVVRSAQGLAQTESGGRRPHPMHRGAAHAKAGTARALSETQDNHDPRSGPAMPPRQGQPQVQGGRPDQLRATDSDGFVLDPSHAMLLCRDFRI